MTSCILFLFNTGIFILISISLLFCDVIIFFKCHCIFTFRSSKKAIEAAIQSHQWNKAVQIIEIQDPSVGERYYPKIAQHYATVRDFEVWTFFAQVFHFLFHREQRVFIKELILCNTWSPPVYRISNTVMDKSLEYSFRRCQKLKVSIKPWEFEQYDFGFNRVQLE